MRLVCAFVLVLLFLAEAHARCDPRERVIRLGLSSQSETPARTRAVSSLRSAINLELQGRACLQVIVDDTLFSTSLSITAMQSGAIEMALPSYSDLAEFSPDYKIFDLPFAFRDYSAVQRFFVLVGDRLHERLTRFGVIPLASWHSHFDQISAKKPIVWPTDLAGMKVAGGKRPAATRILAELDAVEQSVSASEIAAAIKDGRIDAQVTDWASLQDNKTALVHDGVTQTNHAYHGHRLLVSQVWWENQPARIRKSLGELIARITKQANFDAEQRQINAKRAVINSSARVRGLTKKQRDAWLHELKPIWDQIENRTLLDILKMADRAL